MNDYHINIFYSEEDGGYIADIPDLGIVCLQFIGRQYFCLSVQLKLP